MGPGRVVDQFGLKRQRYLIPEAVRKRKMGKVQVTVCGWAGRSSCTMAGTWPMTQEARLPVEWAKMGLQAGGQRGRYDAHAEGEGTDWIAKEKTWSD